MRLSNLGILQLTLRSVVSGVNGLRRIWRSERIKARRFQDEDDAHARLRLMDEDEDMKSEAGRTGLCCGILGSLALLALASGCDKAEPAVEGEITPAKAEAPAAAPAVAPAAAPADGAAAAKPSAAAPAPAKKTSAELGFYDQSGIQPIADNCKSSTVVLAAIPTSIHQKSGFHWRFAEQVMLANQQLKVRPNPESTDGKPVVSFAEAEHKPTGGVALMAKCSTGAACNELAAAYKLVVPTSTPSLFCGAEPATLGHMERVEIFPWDGKPKSMLPAKSDVVAQCVRLAACEAQETGTLNGDPAIQCQKRPSSFATSCALNYPCSKVLACQAQH